MLQGKTVVLVVAMDRHRVIGRDGAMPWHLPADLKHFKETTLGHPVIMGRRTFESIGRPLPERQNLVLSRDPGYQAPGCETAASLEQAADRARGDTLMIIGGGVVYRRAWPHADRLVVTEVDTAIDNGDTWFPEIDSGQWTEQSRIHRPADDRNAFAMHFVHYARAVPR